MQFSQNTPGTKGYITLRMPQPLVSQIARGEVSVFILPEKTDYRGELLLCDDSTMIALCYLSGMRETEGGYEYTVSKTRRVIEFPVKCGKPFEKIYFPEDDVMTYPDSKNIKRWLKLKKSSLIGMDLQGGKGN